MKNVVIPGFVLLFLAFSSTGYSQNNVFISKDVLKTAEWADIKYKDLVKKASAGNKSSITTLFDFHRFVDGVEGLDHGVTCLELIPLAGDKAVAQSIYILKPKLKKVVLDRLILAQGRTQKVELREALSKWAPMTWEVVNGRPLPAAASGESEAPRKDYGTPDRDSNAPTLTPTGPDSGGRQ